MIVYADDVCDKRWVKKGKGNEVMERMVRWCDRSKMKMSESKCMYDVER